MEGDVSNRPVVIGSTSGNDAMSGMGAAAALIGASRSGFGYDSGYSDDGPWKGVVGGGICDLREAVAHTRADIRDSIQSLQSSNSQQFAHVHEKACDAEKEAIRAQYEGKLQTIQTGKEVENRVSDLERNVDVRFCDLEKTVLTEGSLTRAESAAGFSAVALAAAKDAAAISAQLARCCCEQEMAIADLKRATQEGFCKVSEDAVRAQLAAVQDELNEARLEALAKAK